MGRINWKKSLALIPLLGALWLAQSGYVVETLDNFNFSHQFWNTNDFPIRIQIWDGFTDQLPMIVNGSSPKLTIQEALERWARVTSLTIVLGDETANMEASADPPGDGINLVTIADTANNRDLLQLSGNPAGLSSKFSNSLSGEILEADMILNPADTWTTLETGDFNQLNLFDVVLHEFGHHWNLDHPLSRSSTMYFLGGAFSFGLNALSWDDISGVNVTYPLVGLDLITGSISGRVTRGGSSVLGAFVVAVDEQGQLVSNAITLPDGSYNIGSLPPGNYTLYTEPVDGPMTEFSVSGGVFNSPFVTDFLPKFFNDSMAPSVTVTAAVNTAGIDFNVVTGNATLDPELLGQTDNPFGSIGASSAAAEAKQGVDTNLIVGGTGAETLLDSGGVFFLGSNLGTQTVARSGSFGNGSPFKIYPLTVPLDTPQGPYPFFLQNGSAETGVVSGGLEVFSPLRFLQAFAQFADIPGITSGLFLINTHLSQSASGKISTRIGGGSRTAIPLGSLIPDVNGDLDFALSSGGALSVRTDPDGQFVGSLRAQADRRLGGTVLFESASGTTGVGPSRPLYSFMAPVEVENGGLAGGGEVDTGLAITSLDERPTKVYIQIQDANGAVQGSTIVDLEGNGQIANFITQLVGGLPSNFRGSALVTANRQVGATVISIRPGVFTTFPAIQNRVFTRSFFAQFVHLNDFDFSSELVVVNPSPNRSANVTVQVRDTQGGTPSVILSGETLPQGSKNLLIPPLGSAVLTTQSDITGTVELSSTDTPVGGVVLFSSPTVGTAGVGESFPQADFVLPIDQDVGTGIRTGVAMVNTTNQIVQVTLTARDSNGNLAAQTPISLLPRQQLANFSDEDPLRLADPFTGSLWISANREIAATVLRQSPGILTTFPIIPLAEFITPSN